MLSYFHTGSAQSRSNPTLRSHRQCLNRPSLGIPADPSPKPDPRGVLQGWIPAPGCPGPNSHLLQAGTPELLPNLANTRPRCFQIKVLDPNQHFSTKLGCMRKPPTKR